MYSRSCVLAVFVLIFSSVASAGSAVANFVGTDTQTQGSWQGVYGSDGYQLAQSVQNLPAYASFAVQNELDYTWSASTTDSRAADESPLHGLATIILPFLFSLLT